MEYLLDQNIYTFLLFNYTPLRFQSTFEEYKNAQLILILSHPLFISIYFIIKFNKYQTIFMQRNKRVGNRISVFSHQKSSKHTQAHSQSPQTPKRKPIFSQQKYQTTLKKNQHYRTQLNNQQVNQFKADATQFLQKMLSRVETKNNFLKQIQQQNKRLKKQNQQLKIQSNQIVKRIAICSGLEKLKQKNTQYRSKLLKAEALLYQLRRCSKNSIKGIDQLINSLHF